MHVCSLDARGRAKKSKPYMTSSSTHRREYGSDIDRMARALTQMEMRKGTGATGRIVTAESAPYSSKAAALGEKERAEGAVTGKRDMFI